jgi:hypothetical protein
MKEAFAVPTIAADPEAEELGSEPVSLWLGQATALKKTLGVWKAIQERDAKGLGMIRHRLCSWEPRFDDFLQPISGERSPASGDPLALAKVYLAQAINCQRVRLFCY